MLNAEQKMLTVRRRKSFENNDQHEPEQVLNVCEKVFKNGPNACTPNCDKHHTLDFNRINRGICHLYVLGKCTRRDRCWFTHEIPKSILENALTVQDAERFVESRKKDGDQTKRKQPYMVRKDVPNQHLRDVNSNAVNSGGAISLENQTNPSLPNLKPTADTQYPGQSHGENSNQTSLQPQLQPLSHDPFLLLVRTMIQEQIKQQMTQQFQYPLYHPLPSQAIQTR